MTNHLFFKEKEDITYWLERHNIKKYKINTNLTVDVYETVDLSQKNLTYLPIQFGEVMGEFMIDKNQLISLKGSPSKVKYSFVAIDNQLTTLEFSPNYVGHSFLVSNNNLTHLDLAPLYIGEVFDFSQNEINDVMPYDINFTRLEHTATELNMRLKGLEKQYYKLSYNSDVEENVYCLEINKDFFDVLKEKYILEKSQTQFVIKDTQTKIKI